MHGIEISTELIQSCRENKRPAQVQLFNILAPKLLGICFRYTGCREDAEDILQESFILIYTKIDTFRDLGSFEGWCKRITVNVALNWLKKNKNLKQQIEINAKHENKENEDDENLFPLQVPELMEYIALLPVGYRTVLNLYAIEGLSHKEIAHQLGINESTSRSQYTRARHMLLNQIKPHNNSYEKSGIRKIS